MLAYYHWCGYKQWEAVGRWKLYRAQTKTSNWAGSEFFFFFSSSLLALSINVIWILIILTWLRLLWFQEYNELIHEFMTAVKQNYGERVLVQVWSCEQRHTNSNFLVFLNLLFYICSLKTSPTTMPLLYLKNIDRHILFLTMISRYFGNFLFISNTLFLLLTWIRQPWRWHSYHWA